MEDIFEAEPKRSWDAYMKYVPFLGRHLNPKDKIAVLRMAGVIADASVMRRAGVNHHKFREAIPEAFEVSRLKAVALIINSPGGSPAQCSLIANHIRQLSEKNNVPVIAFVEDVAASGGYWLACIGEEIYAQESSIIGSIGVVSAGFGFDDFIKKHDIQRRVHTSGKEKSFMDPFKPEKADDLFRLKTLQENIHVSFKNWVHNRRAGKLNGNDDELMEGAFWTGTDALERGLIDGIGSVFTVMKEKFGDDIEFVDCTPEKKGLLSSLMPFRSDAGIDLGSILEVAEERSSWNRYGL